MYNSDNTALIPSPLGRPVLKAIIGLLNSVCNKTNVVYDNLASSTNFFKMASRLMLS